MGERIEGGRGAMIHGKLYKTRFTEIGFTLNSPGDWRFVDLTDAPDGNKDKMHVTGTSYPTKEQLLLNVERFAAEWGCEGANRPTPPDELIARIAKDYLGFVTIETRNSDSLDFREVAVWSAKAALEAAWKAGKATQ
jgi:hypothetical protein